MYIDRQGKRHNIRTKVGDNVMYLAHRYNIELEGTTCMNLILLQNRELKEKISC